MKLENQVCTLEQAKRLKELGVIQKSLFYHHKDFKRPVFGEYYTGKYDKHGIEIQVCNDKENSVSAYTVAELGVMLQAYLEIGHSFLNICNLPPSWGHTWSKDRKVQGVICWYATEAEARAAMLIYLLENNLTTAAEVNERLKNA